jgi:hypothetical protein
LRLIELERDYFFDRKFHELKKLEFNFAIDESDQYGWRATWGEKKFFTSNDLADFGLRLILDKVAEYRERQANQVK